MGLHGEREVGPEGGGPLAVAGELDLADRVVAGEAVGGGRQLADDVAVPRGRGVFLLAGVPWYESRKPRGAIICMGAISFLRHDVDGDGDADDVDVDTLLLSNVGIPDFTKCSPRLDR